MQPLDLGLSHVRLPELHTMKRTFISTAVLAAALTVVLTAARGMPAETKVPLRGQIKAQPFDLQQVRLLDGPFKDAAERDRRYLHALDSDRLLHAFRVNAGLPSSAEPLGGWERPDCEVRGHSMGHYLSACALMVACTGDQQLRAKADRLVAELATCQKALGASGYLSAFPESFFDRVESCKPVWAPYYTLHKMFAGMIDMHVYCGSRPALDVAEGMARWLKGRLDRIDDVQMEKILNHTEQGGMCETLANLYAVTGNPDHLALALRFNEKHYLQPLARREDKLTGEHANSFIPNVVGTARQYELTGNPRDRAIAEYFWNQVTAMRCYSTGGTSNHEHWRTEPGKLAGELSDFTQETCCTYNMLKLTRHLFTWNPDPKLADYYERALVTSILGTQDPETGMMQYFVVLAPGRWKTFNVPNDAFWCCTGTGMENHARYGEAIYFHDDDSLWVNLFIASELTWKQKGLVLRQETGFPEQEGTALVVRAEKPVDLAIRVRVPYWATRGVSARLNGKPLEGHARPSSYLVVRRTWQDGDRLDVTLPMGLHAAPMPDDKTVVAFMFGPLVLAGELGNEGLTRENTYTGKNFYRFADPAKAPYFLADAEKLDDWIKPVPGRPLCFRTTGQEQDVTLVPYCRLFGQRYAVYWQVYRKDSPEHHAMFRREEALKRRAARVVDEVEIGDAASEKAHVLSGERTASGGHAGRTWRHATAGGWFSYKMKVLPERPTVLACTYWGSDTGARTFDLLIDGQKIATQTLNLNRPDEFFEVETQIPEQLTRGKQKVTVKFQAHPGSFAGGVFGCAVLRGQEQK